MPNTLTHIGFQTPLSWLGIKEAPLQWVALGCIIPDIPWIVQRIFLLVPGIDPVDLLLYVATQASLAYCLILSLALAMLCSSSRKIFLILALNCLLHLLIDASQSKWGNGVNFLIPFSWQTTNLGLFWPEHFSNTLLAIMGGGIFLLYWSKAIHSTSPLLKKPTAAKTVCFATCLACYCLSPALLLNAAYEADIHYSKTLSSTEPRTGKTVELDRGRYSATNQSIRSYTGEQFTITSPPLNLTPILTVRAQFQSENTLQLTEYHTHRTNRDYASYVGLLLTLLLWIHTLFFQTTHKNMHRSPQ
ncbi:MAG: hypothetical protein K9K37_01590 [Desulfocapsa sp.]|nr:hypothetical protein [Desulfocapsa sp.]